MNIYLSNDPPPLATGEYTRDLGTILNERIVPKSSVYPTVKGVIAIILYQHAFLWRFNAASP